MFVVIVVVYPFSSLKERRLPFGTSKSLKPTFQSYDQYNTTTTTPNSYKNTSVILASNPEDIHNFDTLTSYLTPSLPPNDPHQLTPSGFFRLLHAFLLHLPSNQQKFYDVLGSATVAALLQKLPATMMDIGMYTNFLRL